MRYVFASLICAAAFGFSTTAVGAAEGRYVDGLSRVSSPAGRYVLSLSRISSPVGRYVRHVERVAAPDGRYVNVFSDTIRYRSPVSRCVRGPFQMPHFLDAALRTPGPISQV